MFWPDMLVSNKKGDVSRVSYMTGYPMKRLRTPSVINTRPPTLTHPLLVNISHSLFSFSFGSGLCSQSSFSTSSGKSKSPADGNILYFSETVCVLTFSSSLPALEGVLESSNGSCPNARLSLACPSELQLVLRELKSGVSGDCKGPGDSSSRNLCVLDLVGGRSNSADSAGVLL